MPHKRVGHELLGREGPIAHAEKLLKNATAAPGETLPQQSPSSIPARPIVVNYAESSEEEDDECPTHEQQRRDEHAQSSTVTVYANTGQENFIVSPY